MPSADSLLKRHSELKSEVASEKRAVRVHRARLREKKSELVSVVEALTLLGIEVEQAKGENYGRPSSRHRH